MDNPQHLLNKLDVIRARIMEGPDHPLSDELVALVEVVADLTCIAGRPPVPQERTET